MKLVNSLVPNVRQRLKNGVKFVVKFGVISGIAYVMYDKGIWSTDDRAVKLFQNGVEQYKSLAKPYVDRKELLVSLPPNPIEYAIKRIFDGLVVAPAMFHRAAMYGLDCASEKCLELLQRSEVREIPTADREIQTK